MTIGVDVTPLSGPRGGVRRMVEGWLAGLAAIEGAPPVARLVGSSRRALAAAARAAGVDVLLSPWSAFPRVALPVVVTVHELPFVRWGPIEGRVRALVHRRWLARDAREAAAIVVPSDATRRDVLALHPEAGERVYVVPHAFDPAPWRAAATRRDAAGAGGAAVPASARPTAVVVGASSRRKGLDVLVDALPLAGDVRWVVVGVPPRDVARRLVAAGVELRGELDDDALQALVASATLLVHPSRSEGFGFPPLEAMAAGVPVVATRGGAVPEVAGDAALLVEPGDARALAAAVRRVLDDAALRRRLVGAGARRADAFPKEAAARALLRVLERARGRG